MDRLRFLQDTCEMLQAQGGFSVDVNTGDCMYEHPETKFRCAIGLHLPKRLSAEWKDLHNNESVVSLLRNDSAILRRLEHKYGQINDEDIDFLNVVQRKIHDNRARDNRKPAGFTYAKRLLRDWL